MTCPQCWPGVCDFAMRPCGPSRRHPKSRLGRTTIGDTAFRKKGRVVSVVVTAEGGAIAGECCGALVAGEVVHAGPPTDIDGRNCLEKRREVRGLAMGLKRGFILIHLEKNPVSQVFAIGRHVKPFTTGF